MKKNAGIVPEGIWVLDQSASRKLEPVSHTLWVLKDDGKELSWVSIETGADGVHRVSSWTGEYGGPPSVVSGNGFVASLRALGPDEMETFGEVPELGPYTERCKVAADRRQMICNGRVETPDGELTWYEVFNLQTESPHLPLADDL